MSVNTVDGVGELTTPSLVFDGTRMQINFDGGQTGWIKVEMLDPAGAPIAGFTANDADVITGNFTAGTMSWNGSNDLRALRDQPVRLHFIMSNAKLYAFQFVQPGGLLLPGDANGDGGLDISDAVATLGFLFLGSPTKLPCGDGSAADPANQKLVDWQPDGSIDISDAVAMLSFLFLGGHSHTLAPEVDQRGCVRIVGCPDQCGE